MIQVIVISLLRCSTRRVAMTAHLDALAIPFTFFDGIDGENLTDIQIARHSHMPRGHIGCSESYREVLHRIATGDAAFVCVLEDDARLTIDAVSLLTADLSMLPEFDVLRFGGFPSTKTRSMVRIARLGEIEFLAILRPAAGMAGQIFSRNGARKIIASIDHLDAPIDTALFVHHRVFGLRIIETRPRVIWCADFSSTTGPVTRTRGRFLQRGLQRRMRHLRGILNFIAAWRLSVFRLHIGVPP